LVEEFFQGFLELLQESFQGLPPEWGYLEVTENPE
jgi:hypothetical protein